VEPEALAITAGVLTAWVVSHAFGVGEVLDILLGVLGTISIGVAVFSGLHHLYDFAVGAYRGRSPADFEIAADHLAAAIGILGIQAVLAVMFSTALQGAWPDPRRGSTVVYGPRSGFRD